MRFRDSKTWWILSLLPQGLYTVSIRLHIRAKTVLNACSTNIVWDTSTLILSRETQLAPSTRNTFLIKKQKTVRCPKARVRWTMHHCFLTESLPQWSLFESYYQVGINVDLINNWAEEVPVGITLIVSCLLAGLSDALSNCCQDLLLSNRMWSNSAKRWLPANGCARAALFHKDTLGPVCFNLFDWLLSNRRFWFHMLFYLLYIILFIVFPGMPVSSAYIYATPTAATSLHLPLIL